MEKFKYIISWLSWPGLMLVCMSVSAYGFSAGHPIIYFNVAYAFMIVALLMLENWMPHEESWQDSDGQLLPDIAHTLSSKGTVQGIMIFSGAIGLAELIKPMAEIENSLWPVSWPMWAQVSLAVVAAEFGLYWAHRTAHEWPILWRFHAVHHSVKRLWVINTGRFHFLDSVYKILLGMGILFAMGAPLEVVQWVSIITAYIGLLTHCNVEMRFGWLSYIFNTPGVHRFHHSLDLREGDANYGENVVLWDLLFGTYVVSKQRPPVDIGIRTYMPPLFRHQLIWPFLSKAKRLEIQGRYKEQGDADTEKPVIIEYAKAA